MSEYSQAYKTISDFLYQSNEKLIREWAKDDSNPELKESCLMLIDAAEGTK